MRVFQKHVVVLGSRGAMGRSVPPWRTRVEVELSRWQAYARALSSSDRSSFEHLLNDVRQRRAAGGMLPSHDVWHPMVLSMLVGLMSRIAQLEARLAAVEEVRCDD
jgi:hypothetical protein